MTIFIGADHRGFELKNRIMEYLQDKNIRVEDMGAYQYDAEDDYPDFAQKVAEAVLQNPSEFLGIVTCGSGVGVSIAVNRYKGIRCAIGFETDQVSHAKENDHINVLSIPSDYVTIEKAQEFIDTFIETKQKENKKYTRRTKKLDK